MDREVHIGAHVVRTEPPDLVVVSFVGDVSDDEMRRIIAEQRRFEEGKRYVLLIAEVSHMRSVAREAREVVPAATKGTVARGLAVVGASFHVRVVASLIMKGAAVLNRHTDQPARFFATDAQARSWLAARRAELMRGGA